MGGAARAPSAERAARVARCPSENRAIARCPAGTSHAPYPDMRFTKIVCPVDFSACSQEALRVATELARDGSAQLVVAHVWEPPRWSSGEVMIAPEVIQNMVDAEQAELENWRTTAKQLGAREVGTRFLTGVAWDAILALLKDDPAVDLVVMGTHGRTGLRHVLLGSVAEKVVRHAPCPVLVVRERERG
jgi:nucleotide-binding universal stress UspA family protein